MGSLCVALLAEGKLDQLLLWCCRDNQAAVTGLLRQLEWLQFILDGYDEPQGPLGREVEEAEVQSQGGSAAPLNQEDSIAEVLPSHHHPNPGFVESRALAETTTL